MYRQREIDDAAYRNEELRQQRDEEALRHLTTADKTAMAFVLKACLDDGLKLEPALDLWKAECTKRREEAA